MAATESSSQRRSHLEVTPEEFERRLAAHGHSAEEIHHLWEELAAEEPLEAGPALGLGAIIAVYLGLLLVVAASVSLLLVYWEELGAWGVLALGVTFLVGYLAAAEILRRRDLAEPADVLEAVAVGWVGLATYAVQELVGVWPEGASDSSEVHRGLTTIAVVGLAAACLLMLARPDALLIVPVAAATVILAVDVAELVFGARLDDLSGRRIGAFLLPVGLAWIVAGLWLDVTRRRSFATWAYWCGLAIAGIAVVSLVPKTVPGFALVGLLGAIAMFFSAFIRHWSFTIVGAAGVLTATALSISELGNVAPVIIAAVGLALIFVGLRWSRWRESIRAAVLARAPVRARRLVERLAP
jgi:hypothetical protein